MRLCLAIVMLAASFATLAQVQSRVTPRLLTAQELKTSVDQSALQRQYDSLQAMPLRSVEYSRFGSVKRLIVDAGLPLPLSVTALEPGDSGNVVLALFKDALLAEGTESLTVISNDEVDFTTRLTVASLRLAQTIRGVPVINSFLGIDYDPTTRNVSKLVATFVPDRGLDDVPILSAARAEQLVAEALASVDKTADITVQISGTTHQAYYLTPADPTPPRLVWVVQAHLSDGMEWAYYVDAIKGVLIDRAPLTLSLTTKVYNANGANWDIPEDVPSTSMTSSQIAANPFASEANAHVLNVDPKLRSRFSLPSSSFPTQTRQVINYGSSPNAGHRLVNGHDYLLYSGPYSGGSLPATNSSTKPLDITAHEYTHGIGRRLLPNLGDLYDFQWAAIQEAFGDIGSATVQIAVAGAPSSASWRMGEGWFTSSPSAYVRSMADPALGTSPYAPNADWYSARCMNCSGHFNSTIVSHAYYLSIYGGLNAQWLKTYIPEITVQPLDSATAASETSARRIFVAALRDLDVANEPTMWQLRNAAVDAASALFPVEPSKRTSILQAFQAVGIGYQCNSPPPTPNWFVENLQCRGRFSVTWPATPNTNRYLVIVAPQLYGWSFAQTATDGTNTHCMLGITTPSMAKMAACNNCGCSEWTETAYLPYSSGPCP